MNELCIRHLREPGVCGVGSRGAERATQHRQSEGGNAEPKGARAVRRALHQRHAPRDRRVQLAVPRVPLVRLLREREGPGAALPRPQVPPPPHAAPPAMRYRYLNSSLDTVT